MMRHESITRTHGGGTIFTVHPALNGSIHTREQCEKHGRLEPLDTEVFTLEQNGVEWVPKDGVAMAYCPDCVDQERGYELKDAHPHEVLADYLSGGLTFDRIEYGFDPVRAEGREIQHCPYGGEELTQVNERNGFVTCPEHGPLRVEVQER